MTEQEYLGRLGFTKTAAAPNISPRQMVAIARGALPGIAAGNTMYNAAPAAKPYMDGTRSAVADTVAKSNPASAYDFAVPGFSSAVRATGGNPQGNASTSYASQFKSTYGPMWNAIKSTFPSNAGAMLRALPKR